jgi:hypothetical protein
MDAENLLNRVVSIEEKLDSIEKQVQELLSLLKTLVPSQVPKLERNLSKKKEDRIQQLIHAQHPI